MATLIVILSLLSESLRVEVSLKTDSGYPKDVRVGIDVGFESRGFIEN